MSPKEKARAKKNRQMRSARKKQAEDEKHNSSQVKELETVNVQLTDQVAKLRQEAQRLRATLAIQADLASVDKSLYEESAGVDLTDYDADVVSF